MEHALDLLSECLLLGDATADQIFLHKHGGVLGRRSCHSCSLDHLLLLLRDAFLKDLNGLGHLLLDYGIPYVLLLNDGPRLLMDDLGTPVLLFYEILVRLVDYWLVHLVDDLLVALVDDRLVDLVHLLLVYHRLVMLMDYLLMVLVDNILVVLMNDLLMVLMNLISVNLFHNRRIRVHFDAWSQGILIDYHGLYMSVDHSGLVVSNHSGLSILHLRPRLLLLSLHDLLSHDRHIMHLNDRNVPDLGHWHGGHPCNHSLLRSDTAHLLIGGVEGHLVDLLEGYLRVKVLLLLLHELKC